VRRAGGIAVLAALASVPLWLGNPYHLHVLIMAGIFSVLALSLNLLLGYAGQLSLGHAAFFGLGAYATALGTVKLGWSPWAGLVLALVAPGLAGWAVGRIALRIRGAYFVLLTVSFAGVISLISVNWMELTNGPLGIPGVPALALPLPGLGEWPLRRKPAFYGVMLAAAALSYLVCARLVRSRVGRALVALRENETLAESVGIDATHYLVLATVVSAAMAGLGGWLYAHYTRFVSPEVFLFGYTVTMVIMVVAGGKGTLAGPVVGAALFTALPEALREATSWQWQMLAYGVILMLVLYFLPRGIVPALSAWAPRRTAAPGVGPAPPARESA
jgi:branched-chain amino acid transport system permease protein